MNVIFSESVNSGAADIFVIVSHSLGLDFIEKKIKSCIASTIPDGILEDCRELKYRDTRVFDLVVDGKLRTFIVASAGDKDKITRSGMEKLGGYIYNAILSKKSISDAYVVLFNNTETYFELSASYIASGIYLKSWVFDKYKSKKNPIKIKTIECSTVYIDNNTHMFDVLKSIDEGVFLTRNLVTEPSNIMTTDQMLLESQELKKYGVKVSFLDEQDMEKLGMNALLGVGKGSEMPSYTIILEYRPNKNKDLISLVGKGLTFDSGGICLKPSNNMGEMKGDMTGAAVVLGTIKSLALRNADVNIVGIIGVTENMISGRAQRPGDVVVSMSQKTIEIDNTDAEGRLVLADVLWYVQEKYSPKVIVDLATLTGAIKIALGHEYAGLFSNSDDLSKNLSDAGNFVGEKLWRLPLQETYDDDIESEIADIKNCGSGRGAGSITAAMFLQRFIQNDVEWAHLDIAATEWDKKSRALSQKGATGFGVRLLNEFIDKYYDK